MNTKSHLQSSREDEVSKKLIERLRRIEARYLEVWKEYKKRRKSEKRKILFTELYRLEKEWMNVKRSLHEYFRPIILERDGYKCRVCGSSEKLELSRLFNDSLVMLYAPLEEQALFKYSGPYRTPEERYSEKTMFILCRKCHTRFDSFIGRLWRSGPTAIETVEEAVEFLNSEDFQNDPPWLKERWKKYEEERLYKDLLIFFNALGKVAAFKAQNDLKKARRHLGVARRELTFYLRGGFLGQDQHEQFVRKLQLVRMVLDSGDRCDEMLDEIRRELLKAIRTKVSPEVFSKVECACGLTSTETQGNKNENTRNTI